MIKKKKQRPKKKKKALFQPKKGTGARAVQ